MYTHIPKRTLYLYRTTLVFMAFVFAIIIYCIYLMVWPFKTADIVQPIQISNAPITAGQVVVYSVKECRYTHSNSHVERRLLSQTTPNLYLPLVSSDNDPPPGCQIIHPAPLVIPIDTPPGIYKIQFDITYQVNPLRNIKQTSYSIKFQIIAPPNGKTVVVQQIIYSGAANNAGQQNSKTTTTTTNTPTGSYSQPSTTKTTQQTAPANPQPAPKSPTLVPQPKPNPVVDWLSRNIVQPVQKLLQ